MAQTLTSMLPGDYRLGSNSGDLMPMPSAGHHTLILKYSISATAVFSLSISLQLGITILLACFVNGWADIFTEDPFDFR